MGFTIKKIEETYELISFNYPVKGFSYPLKKNKNNTWKIKELIIVNPDIISALISHNFDKKFQKIVELFFSSNDYDEDSTGTSLMMALDEVAHLRTIIISKYKRYLKKEKEEEFLKKLKVLENELRVKIIDFKLIKEQSLVHNNIEEKNKSR
mgnify:FL=1